eukprot:SAG11_NODE_24_length_24699_cov_10.132195_7_plen_234_part_00
MLWTLCTVNMWSRQPRAISTTTLCGAAASICRHVDARRPTLPPHFACPIASRFCKLSLTDVNLPCLQAKHAELTFQREYDTDLRNGLLPELSKMQVPTEIWTCLPRSSDTQHCSLRSRRLRARSAGVALASRAPRQRSHTAARLIALATLVSRRSARTWTCCCARGVVISRRQAVQVVLRHESHSRSRMKIGRHRSGSSARASSIAVRPLGLKMRCLKDLSERDKPIRLNETV